MMSTVDRLRAEYASKLRTPDDAVSKIANDTLVIFGTGMSEPQLLLWSVSNLVRDAKLEKLRVFCGPPAYYAADSLCGSDIAHKIERVLQFVSVNEHEAIRNNTVSYLPHQFHQIPRIIEETMDVGLAITTVSPMDDEGYFTLGTNNDFIGAAVRCARQVIVEVNRNMPKVHGDARVHISEVDSLVENHILMPPVERIQGGPVDEKIASIIADLVPEGATIQVGSGALPGMVCAALENHRNLGIHTELMVPGLLDLVACGAANGSMKTEKPGKHVFTLVIGNANELALIHDNPDFESHPVTYTNYPANIARNERMTSINSALQVDLLGQVNSESLDGYQFSGAGGQLDFVRGAYDAKDGKSILAFHATARKGSVSRVVPTLDAGSVVTTPRSDTHWVVTEFGAVDLKGKSVKQRARALIELAHPDFREDLQRASRELHLV